MKKCVIILFIILPLCVLSQISFHVKNPSFEGFRQAHYPPSEWTTCMFGQTPDTQPGIWGVYIPPTNGYSYVGLVAQPISSWQEGVAQKLSIPLLEGLSYNMLIDLACTNVLGEIEDESCGELEVWGGFYCCDKIELLWKSGFINQCNTWETYVIAFEPTKPFTHLLFQIHSLGCVDGFTDHPYIIIDNLRPLCESHILH